MKYLHIISATPIGDLQYTITMEYKPETMSSDIDAALHRMPMVEGDVIDVRVNSSLTRPWEAI